MTALVYCCCVLLALVAVTILGAHTGDQAPPLPQFALVTRGTLLCDSACVYCAGPANGTIVGHYQYSDDSDGALLTNYREDAVLIDSPITYNRELWNTSAQFELGLYGDAATSLSCYYRDNPPTKMSRYFTTNGTFAGSMWLLGTHVDMYNGTWLAAGMELPYTGFVTKDKVPRVFGWRSLCITYVFWEMEALSSPFPSSVWAVPPGLACTNMNDVLSDGGGVKMRGD